MRFGLQKIRDNKCLVVTLFGFSALFFVEYTARESYSSTVAQKNALLEKPMRVADRAKPEHHHHHHHHHQQQQQEQQHDENDDQYRPSKPVTQTLPQPRQQKSTVKKEKSNKISKVLILGYMRGGTSVFGELFNRHPADLMWYEPLDQLYSALYGLRIYSIPLTLLYTIEDHSRRELGVEEKTALNEYLSNMLTCNVKSLPIETFVHPFVRQSAFLRRMPSCRLAMSRNLHLAHCIAPIARDCGSKGTHRRSLYTAINATCRETIAWFRTNRVTQLNATVRSKLRQEIPGFKDTDGKRVDRFYKHYRCIRASEMSSARQCINTLADKCNSAGNERPRIIATEVLRANLGDLEPLIKKVGDVRVIHYVRDPRAIAVSRVYNVGLGFQAQRSQSLTVELQLLCDRMWDDLLAADRLNSEYPGTITTIRYEDLVAKPNTTVEAVFRAAGQPMPAGIVDWLTSKMFAKKPKSSAFGTNRGNATVTANKWKKKMKSEQKTMMLKMCRRVLEKLNYAL